MTKEINNLLDYEKYFNTNYWIYELKLDILIFYLLINLDGGYIVIIIYHRKKVHGWH